MPMRTHGPYQSPWIAVGPLRLFERLKGVHSPLFRVHRFLIQDFVPLTVGSEQQPSSADVLERGSFRIERSRSGSLG